MSDLNTLLSKKKPYLFLKIFADYAYQTIIVFIFFLGVLVFDIAYIKAMIPVFLLAFFTMTLLARSPYIIPLPQNVLNALLFSSFVVYIAKNSDNFFMFVLPIFSIMLYLKILKSIALSKINEISDKTKKFDTPIHELGHYFVNEEYQMFQSLKIELTPDDKSLGRLEIRRKSDNVNVSNFLSFLMAGCMASDYLLNDYIPDIDEAVGIIEIEMKFVNLTKEDSEVISKALSNPMLVCKVIDDTLKVIKKYKKQILKLAEEIHGKEKVLCEDLFINEEIKEVKT